MKKVLDNYLDASIEPYRGNPIAKLIRKELPDCFKNFTDHTHEYKIKGSAGAAQWAVVPWISFMNENITSSPQNGYYVAYLFKEDMTGFYLSLMLGASEFNKKYGKNNLPVAAHSLRNILEKEFFRVFDYVPMDLGSRDGYTKRPTTLDYENADIFNIEYSIENLPSESKLKEDLIFLLELYDYIYQNVGNDYVLDKDVFLLLKDSKEKDEEDTNIPLTFRKPKISPLSVDDSINLSIQNFGAISDSDIKISKINVIGGQNATGKSTASKLLYCFLKYNSAKRQEYAYSSVINQIQSLISMSRRFASPFRFGSASDFMENHYNKFMIVDDIYSKLEIYGKIKEAMYNSNFMSRFADDKKGNMIYDEMDEIDRLIDIISGDGDDLFNLIMKSLLESEFSNKMKGFAEFKGYFKNTEYSFSSNFSNEYNFSRKGEFFVNDVFYIDSFSSLDINQINSLHNTDHVQSLVTAIQNESNESYDVFDDIKNENIIKIEEDINKLINGKFKYDDGELKYSDEYGVSCAMANTASGIKQIGIIQLLLANRKLKPNSFLIIDEPEVNLHPEWQIKLAEILVKLVNDLDVYIYINTHSPMFIEAMTLYSEKEGLLEDTNIYLTKKHKLGGYYFKQIFKGNMSEVYSNLAKPYDILDAVRSDILSEL